MFRALSTVVVAATLACAPDSGGSSSADSSSSGGECLAEGCVCSDAGDCDDGLVCASRICTPSAVDSSSSSGGAEASGSTTSTSTEEDTSPDGTTAESTSFSSAADNSSSSGADSTTGPVCGDGTVDVGEDCDDGNVDAGDGCDATCGGERWQHVGVAHDVPVADLHGWELCWSGDYGAGDLVDLIPAKCTGDHLMMACRMKDADNLAVAAHAPSEDVLFPVDYGAGERHEANGVNWYWSPTSNIEGFAPAGNMEGCDAQTDGVQPDFLCWVNDDGEPLKFSVGRRCSTNDINADEALLWERLVFQSWS